MRLDDEQESSNFEIQSPGRGGGFGFPMGGGGSGIGFGRGGLGCGSIVLIAIAALIFGINPLSLLGLAGGGAPVGNTPSVQSRGDVSQATPEMRTALKVLGSTERVWADIFAKAGQQYRPSPISFYSRTGQSGCGAAQSAMGPFYCPSDYKIYLDMSFFEELRSRFGVAGDFPMAYVISHEVGHHIQNITGVADKVRAAQARVSRAEGNRYQVAMELQADCYAGVWARNDTNLLEAGDIEEGLRAASAIGDDTLQRQSQGVVVPESFTHGTSAQRMEWLKRGLQTGDPNQCDTFSQL